MSNNVYKQCPAKMEDGRFITRWESTNDLTHAIQNLNGIQSSNRFRTFLQENTDMLIANEREYNEMKYDCHPMASCSEGFYYLNVRPIDPKYHKTNWTYDNSVKIANMQAGKLHCGARNSQLLIIK